MGDERRRGPGHRTDIILLLLAFYGLGTLYSITVPIFEAPDEDGHFTYVKYMAQTGTLPQICLGDADCSAHNAARLASYEAEPVSPYVISHPPLYYALAALATSWIDMPPLRDTTHYNPHFDYGVRGLRGNKNAVIHTKAEVFPYQGASLAVHIGRWVSLLVGGGAVLGTYLLAQEIMPNRRWLALGSASITAFNPQFLFISARLGNDAAVAGFCAMTLWIMVRFLNHKRSQHGAGRCCLAIGMGALLGLALLSKVNAVGLLPVVALAILVKSAQERSLRSFILWSVLTLGMCTAIGGWWYLRNALLYGDPLLWNVHLDMVPIRESTPTLLELYRNELGGLETSFWAVFGWMNVPISEWVYRVLRTLTRVAVLGLVMAILREPLHRLLRKGGRATRDSVRRSANWTSSRFTSPASRSQAEPVCCLPSERAQQRGSADVGALADGRRTVPGAGIAALVLWLLILALSLLSFMRVQPGAQGRYLFPGISAISLLLLLGLGQWVPPRWRTLRPRRILAGVVASSMLLLAFLCPFLSIAPAYARPAILSADHLPDDIRPLEITYNDEVALLGFALDTEAIHPGQKAEVTLCWEALNEMHQDYSVFLHLFGRNASSDDRPNRERVGQLDIYPGVGAYPTTLWQVGDVFCDDYEIPVVPQATVPVAAVLDVGLYERASMKQLTPIADGGKPAGQVVIGRVKVVSPVWPEYVIGTSAHFTIGESYSLVGYDLPQAAVLPGNDLPLTLYWDVLQETDQDYTVFVHLLDSLGRLWSQADAQPLGGSYPTSFWESGELIRDRYFLALPPDIPEGQYRIELGMYLLSTGHRLPVKDARGVRVEGDRIRLASVEVAGS